LVRERGRLLDRHPRRLTFEPGAKLGAASRATIGEVGSIGP
jgi:hypothetical protein